ncbi:MAG: hypothetical protein IPM23_21845 [Candidatus Melainabacteria bacterium]|nr:hypothetical protein [Candidatus Melainabacteria bacterium]
MLALQYFCSLLLRLKIRLCSLIAQSQFSCELTIPEQDSDIITNSWLLEHRQMIPPQIKKSHVLKVLERLNEDDIPHRFLSDKFVLKYKGKALPPKYVICEASEIATGRQLSPNEFSGGSETNYFLESLGFTVVPLDPVSQHYSQICRKRFCDVTNPTAADYRLMGDVEKLEYECFSIYLESFDALPEFNDPERSLKKHNCSSGLWKTKLDRRAKAEEMYTGDLFRSSFEYARTRHPGASIYILSAKHGLLEPEEEIAPYDESLAEKTGAEQRIWSDKVLNQLEKVADLERDTFIILAGKIYRRHICKHIRNYKLPLEGKRQGEQLRFLKKQVK